MKRYMRNIKKQKSKNCGSCMYFFKWKNDKIGGGLCNLRDGRTKCDYGRGCMDWKGIKYKRNKKYVELN